MTVLDDMSESSLDLLFAALDYALENAAIAPEGFVPFAFLDRADGSRDLTRFVADGDLTDSVNAGRAALATVPAGTTAVALAWDGYLTVDGNRSEAVFVEAHQVGLAKSALLSQRYARTDDTVEPMGNPALQGETDPLARTATPT
ncbi:hypothetical protein Ais01nite_62060 [Asanoa ishikariensis]|uniref:Uncharacterized protein n=1 Tax=Asanoa ishikariensis TaxID=137265 RepID=A0A1H3P261_9ACTN|nr:hypothetical protein [Asanoa ishikariensis]GIF68171.1 hypothetical protein Ais01nite_62060 [Asanoa ishikariensis]SDY95192.1 hypothetical protein SAMN05421684_2522 [Asanoa ishikariensis]